MTTDLEPRAFYGGSWDNEASRSVSAAGNQWRAAPTLYYASVGFRTFLRSREPAPQERNTP